ncbi:histidine kinase [Clostridium sp. AL.422]|uniref:sensor histidine kinase n=1 Tax=Clostridium TaxID=1485 RepID=UPI00293DD22B|nr:MULTISPECIES: histidine kinase [unclassified Clostridium]MDV4149631.1 histidine kinase [Clostridium sp. AL.422]
MKYSDNNIKEIVNNVIEEISLGKSKIFNISDKMRDELQRKKTELNEVKIKLYKVIEEVDYLEKVDKSMRIKLVEESRNILYSDQEGFKSIYEQALEIRVKYITKQSEEKELITRRDALERSLKRYYSSIEEAESAVNQINIALGYLEGNILDELKEENKNSRMINEINILEKQEIERRRIAREIHDGPAQYIANAMMRIDFCKVVVRKDLEKGIKELDDVKGNVKMALKEVRGIIYDLRPLSIEERGLTEAIKEMIGIVSSENNIQINYSVEEFQGDINKIIQIAAYRIIQEILNNIKKHSKAKIVDLRINFTKEYIFIFVKDNGIGFNLKETLANTKTKGNCYGLLGIYERVKSLGGRIEIKSSPNEGTAYKIKLPIIER